MKIFKKKFIVWTLIIIAAGGGYWIYSSSKQSATAPQYVTAKAAKGTLVVSVTGSGQISASNQVNVQAKVSGTISKIYAVNNQRVKTGDLLFSLDTTDDERAVRNA